MEKASAPETEYVEVIIQDKIKLYLEYVAAASAGGLKAFWYDIKLIFRTFWVIVKE